jgi:hypothetical protein
MPEEGQGLEDQHHDDGDGREHGDQRRQEQSRFDNTIAQLA